MKCLFYPKKNPLCIINKNYLYQAHEESGVSPGKFTEEHAGKRMKRRKEVQEKIQLPSTKLRRLVLKQERAVTQGAQEALEGDSYQSGKSRPIYFMYNTEMYKYFTVIML